MAALLFLCAVAWSAQGSDLIAERGKFSDDYAGDWRSLPYGDQLQSEGGEALPWVSGYGEELQRRWIDEPLVKIADTAVRVRWRSLPEKFQTTLFHIKGAKKVVIENVRIEILDEEYRGYNTILVEDVEEVVLRNVYVAGPVHQYHVRIEGAKRVFVDGLEVAGMPGSRGGFRGGGGIWVNNENVKSGSGAETPWVVIQNCYMHDYTEADQFRNHDAINLHSPGNGIVFNCVFRNWGIGGKIGDGAVDVSFRGDRVQGSEFRLERNIFDNCFAVKTPATGHTSNKVVMANNVFRDTEFVDYHSGYEVIVAHNTFLFSKNKGVMRRWRVRDAGMTRFEDNVVWSGGRLGAVIYEDPKGEAPQSHKLVASRNKYLMEMPNQWLYIRGKRPIILTWQEWRSAGQDAGSVVKQHPTCRAVINARSPVDAAIQLSVCAGRPAGEPANERVVDRDFFGIQRSLGASPGAVQGIP